MKKLFLIGIATMLFISCNQETRYTQNSPEIDIVKAIIKDYDTKSYESLIMHYADTATTQFNNAKMPSKDIPKYHKGNDINFSSRGFDIKNQEYEMVKTDDGKTWVNFWGNWKGTLAGNGKEIEIPVHITAQFINGKIVKDHGYWDSAPLVLALQQIEKSKKVNDIINQN